VVERERVQEVRHEVAEHDRVVEQRPVGVVGDEGAGDAAIAAEARPGDGEPGSFRLIVAAFWPL
jgi:hypothetical protein